MVIIGEGPTRESAGPWDGGRAAERLYGWFGASGADELRSMATLANVHDEYPYGAAVALEKRERVRELAGRHDLVFCVGRVAADVVRAGEEGRSPCGLLRYAVTDDGRAVVRIPHPSGRNRQLNGHTDEHVRRLVAWVMETFGKSA